MLGEVLTLEILDSRNNGLFFECIFFRQCNFVIFLKPSNLVKKLVYTGR